VGLIHVGHRLDYPRSMLPNGEGPLDCSPEMADQVDREVKQLLASAYEEAKGILLAHRAELDTVAAALVERESLDKAEFLRLLGLPEATAGADGKPEPAQFQSEPTPS
jgi:ATP-dependent Zn protease